MFWLNAVVVHLVEVGEDAASGAAPEVLRVRLVVRARNRAAKPLLSQVQVFVRLARRTHLVVHD